MAITDQLRAQWRAIRQRYPRPRSAVMPCLHLAQSVEGSVSPEAIEAIAEELDLTPAEVTGVSTFYTMYLKSAGGKYRVGVCINSMCAVLGGDEIWDTLVDYVGIDHFETTPDGLISLERIECQAACTHAPVMTLNWEFLDQQTPESARQLVDRLRAGETVAATRGTQRIETFDAVGETLAGVDQRLSPDDVALDDIVLAGLREAKQRGHAAPAAAKGKP